MNGISHKINIFKKLLILMFSLLNNRIKIIYSFFYNHSKLVIVHKLIKYGKCSQ